MGVGGLDVWEMGCEFLLLTNDRSPKLDSPTTTEPPNTIDPILSPKFPGFPGRVSVI